MLAKVELLLSDLGTGYGRQWIPFKNLFQTAQRRLQLQRRLARAWLCQDRDERLCRLEALVK